MNTDIKRRLLQLIYPSHCPLCDEVIHYDARFCPECREKLESYKGSFRISGAASFSAAFVYDENVLPAIALLKNGVCDNADYALGGELADLLKGRDFTRELDVIIPVPMFSAQLAERTYNQAKLIADIIAEAIEVPVCAEAVMKIRQTADQKTLNRFSRTINLKSAFSAVLPEVIQDKNVLLVDDICTTGSTLAEITKLLLSVGAKSVHCAVCCKTPLKRKKKINDEN